ncbi:LamG-like jellyroll fold domain-containing protein [Frondihabitans sp. 4ASC-45]|uniref:LamG-like jellyroll fold domain-containing protein n=1 Tax=Frondihabitans sp. 4ASC-45 TaxID=3111636 RepID=UPI003C1D1DE7
MTAHSRSDEATPTLLDSATADSSTGDSAQADNAEVDRLPIAAWTRLLAAVIARTTLLSLLCLMLWAAVPALFGWLPTSVMSGSMAPRILTGDVVVAMPLEADDIAVGQVLLADDPDHADRLRLHRLVEKSDRGLITRGDANPGDDSTATAPSSVLGVGVLRVPLVGWPAVWLATGAVIPLLVSGAAVASLLAVGRLDAPLRQGLRRADEARSLVTSASRLRRAASARGVGLSVVAIGTVACLITILGAGAAWSTTTTTHASAETKRFPCLDKVADAPFFWLGYNEVAGTVAENSAQQIGAGTIQGSATRVAGSCGDSSPYLQLDGQTAYVSGHGVTSAPQVFTIETWFTTTENGGRLIGFSSQATGASTARDRHIYIDQTGHVTFGLWNYGAYTVTSPRSYTDGHWHLATAMMSSAGMALYVDGVLVGTNKNKQAEATKGYWRIGYDEIGSYYPGAPANSFFEGGLDNTALYLKALTAQQVATHYAAGR